jgi:hypothetical protein
MQDLENEGVNCMVRIPKHIRERLNQWNLKRVPFPSVPIIDPYNVDPLQNGSIFAVNLREQEIEHMRQKIFGKGYDDAVRLWSWCYARRKVGRNVGMGKTALLLYISRSINRDFGRSFFGSQTPWLCTYVLVSPKTHSLEDLLAQILLQMTSTVHGPSVLELLRATIRRKVIVLNRIQGNNDTLERATLQKFTQDTWLEQQGIDLEQLAHGVTDYLTENKIKPAIAGAFAQNTFREYLETLNGSQNTFKSNTNLTKNAHDIFLNEIARIVKLGGLTRLTILMDDMYYLITQTPQGSRADLATHIRNIIVDGQFYSLHNNTYNWVAVIHTVTAGKFNAAWELRDLHRIAKLDYQNDQNGLALRPIPFTAARQILETYITSQRLRAIKNDSCFPFTTESLDAIASISQEAIADPGYCEPRHLLQSAYEVAIAALQHEELLLPISVDFVRHVLEGVPLPITDLNKEDEDTGPILSATDGAKACPCSCHESESSPVFDLLAIYTNSEQKVPIRYLCGSCNVPVDLPN